MSEGNIFKVGNAVISKVYETSLGFEATTLFPKWQHAPQKVYLSVHSWLVKDEGKIYLIDTGIGKDKPRASALFNQQNHPFLEELAKHGVTPEQVDYVLITHIHTDHVGWNTVLKDGEWKATFPNARYIIPEESYQFQLSEKGKATSAQPCFKDSVLPLVEAGLVDFIPAAGGLFDGKFEYFPTPGHCTGHMSIRLNSEQQSALFAGDVMHALEQITDPQMGSMFCEDKPQADLTRIEILNQVAESNALYFSSHFGGSSVGRISKNDEGYVWHPVNN
ncbi:MBL fold metallo-hydrolase [Rouxiella sp. T17]|uniref:MBL fold metallo-hydrolase n=1 Tax=Rouxiella sp. T17 TaxID=3085684 RepID=UPI002FC635ED